MTVVETATAKVTMEVDVDDEEGGGGNRGGLTSIFISRILDFETK